MKVSEDYLNYALYCKYFDDFSVTSFYELQVKYSKAENDISFDEKSLGIVRIMN